MIGAADEGRLVNYLKSGDVEIAYLDEGEGPSVLLGHCSAASHKEWAPLIDILAEDWRVLAPDFIGYGNSDHWPAEKTFSIIFKYVASGCEGITFGCEAPPDEQVRISIHIYVCSLYT